MNIIPKVKNIIRLILGDFIFILYSGLNEFKTPLFLRANSKLQIKTRNLKQIVQIRTLYFYKVDL